MAYISIITLMFLSSFVSIDKRINKQSTLVIALYIGAILVLFAGLRNQIGYDYQAYIEHFQDINLLNSFEQKRASLEPGYEYLVSFFKTIFNNPIPLFLFMASITIILLISVSFKYSPYPLLSILLFFAYYYFPQVMGQFRQPIAILLVYLGLPFLKKRRFILFILLVLLVYSTFHRSVILIIPLYFLVTYEIRKKWLITLFLISIILSPFIQNAFLLIISKMPDSLSIKNALIIYSTWKAESIKFTPGMLEKTMFFFLFLFFYGDEDLLKINPYANILIRMYFMGVILYFSLIGFSSNLAARGTHILTFSMILIIPSIFKILVNPLKKIGLISLIYIVSIYMCISFLLKNWEIYFPYKTVLEVF